MSVDFFKQECLTTTNEKRFGICDGENNAVAFTKTDNESEWIATVINNDADSIEFRAIDYCVVIRREDGNQEKSCDCILIYPKGIVFIELKDERSGWMERGIKQVEMTVSHFAANHDLSAFRHKKAFVANKRHPDFHVLDIELKRRFWDRYKVRINVQAEIVL